jgi:hypothetical protein
MGSFGEQIVIIDDRDHRRPFYTIDESRAVTWAFNNVSNYKLLDLIPLLRYFECSKKTYMFTQLYERGIIKPTDPIVKPIISLLRELKDKKTIKWFKEHGYNV